MMQTKLLPDKGKKPSSKKSDQQKILGNSRIFTTSWLGNADAERRSYWMPASTTNMSDRLRICPSGSLRKRRLEKLEPEGKSRFKTMNFSRLAQKITVEILRIASN